MSKTEIMEKINETIDHIKWNVCHTVEDSMDASYVANGIETWLDTLRDEIREYDDAEEE